MLGILPTELIQLVLRSCDTPTFLQLAFSCRTLLEIASGTRDLLLHHVTQTPGWNDGLDECCTRELFQRLLERSHEQLFGAEFYVKRRTFDFQGKVIDTRASSLRAAGLVLQAVLAFQGHSFVDLYTMLAGHLSLQRRFQPPGEGFGETRILHTAADRCTVWVLHRFLPFIDRDLDTSHPFVKHALQSNAQGSIFLARYDRCDPESAIRLYGFPDHNGYEPIAFAIDDQRFAISWQHMQRSDDHQVVLYSTFEDGNSNEAEGGFDTSKDEPDAHKNLPVLDSSYDSYVLTERSEHETTHGILLEKGPTRRLAFNDRGNQLLHHYGAHTLYGSFQRIKRLPAPAQSRPDVKENACVARFSGSLSLSFSIGIPFFGTHEDSDVFGSNSCHWQYLSIGIATHRVQHWTVACLLRSESHPSAARCGGSGHEWNLERGRRFDNWEVMAQLGDFRESTTSQGLLIATSRMGTRIAIANWKTVSIWALEPSMVIEDEFSYYPESWQTSDGFPILRPTVIQLDAVCSQLRFTGQEDELVALTDRGLLFLDLRPDNKAVQVTERQIVAPPGEDM